MRYFAKKHTFNYDILHTLLRLFTIFCAKNIQDATD